MHYVISTKILDQTLQDMCLNIMVNFLDFLLWYYRIITHTKTNDMKKSINNA